jgi:hypothetical protein
MDGLYEMRKGAPAADVCGRRAFWGCELCGYPAGSGRAMMVGLKP